MKRFSFVIVAMIMLAISFSVAKAESNVIDEFITPRVVKNTARQLVDDYRPAKDEMNYYHTPRGENMHGAFFTLRYEVHQEKEEKTGESVYRGGYNLEILKVVKTALTNPKFLRFVYETYINSALNEMKARAMERQKEEEGLHGLSRLSKEDVKDMFYFYQEAAWKLSRYLGFAIENGQKLKPLFEEVRKAEARYKASWKKYADISDASDKEERVARDENTAASDELDEKEKQLLEASGPGCTIMGEGGYMKVYPVLWFERRRAEGGDDLLRMYKRLVDDAAARLGKVADEI